LFACFGHHDLEVTREWLIFGERVGRFGNFLKRHQCRRVPTRAIQQIIVSVYREDTTPAALAEDRAEPVSQGDGGTPAPTELATLLEEKIRKLFNEVSAPGNGELAIVEKPGGEPTPYYTGLPTAVLLNWAEKLHHHIAASRPSLPPVAVIDKPANAVRAELEAMGREARAVLENPSLKFWWQRRPWLRRALVAATVAGLAALLSLLWDEGVDGRWKWVGVGCVLLEAFVVYALTAPGEPQVTRANRPPPRRVP
jgi:hypothetical protein